MLAVVIEEGKLEPCLSTIWVLLMPLQWQLVALLVMRELVRFDSKLPQKNFVSVVGVPFRSFCAKFSVISRQTNE